MNCSAICVLTAAGIHGMEAETSLRRMLAALAAQGPVVQAGLEALSVDPDSVDPSHERIVDIVRRLADARLDETAALAMFGNDGGRAALAMIASIERLEALENGDRTMCRG
jgi:hypothetical protein